MAAASIARHYRAHRAEMVLAIELGITPLAAREELARRAAQASLATTMARAAAMGVIGQAAISKSASATPATTTETEKPLPWWQRD